VSDRPSRWCPGSRRTPDEIVRRCTHRAPAFGGNHTLEGHPRAPACFENRETTASRPELDIKSPSFPRRPGTANRESWVLAPLINACKVTEPGVSRTCALLVVRALGAQPASPGAQDPARGGRLTNLESAFGPCRLARGPHKSERRPPPTWTPRCPPIKHGFAERPTPSAANGAPPPSERRRRTCFHRRCSRCERCCPAQPRDAAMNRRRENGGCSAMGEPEPEGRARRGPRRNVLIPWDGDRPAPDYTRTRSTTCWPSRGSSAAAGTLRGAADPPAR